MLTTRVAINVAAILVVISAFVGQLSFRVACGIMVVFSVLLPLISNFSNDENDHNDRLQNPAAVGNHLPSPSTAASGRETGDMNYSNNSNCIPAHSTVQSTYSVGSSETLPGRTSSQEVLRRPPILSRSDLWTTQTTVTTYSTPSRSDLQIATSSSSTNEHLLPAFQRLSAGLVLGLILQYDSCLLLLLFYCPRHLRIENGKPFHACAATTGKVQSPNVTHLVDQCRRRSRPKTPLCIYVGGLAEESQRDKVGQYH